MLILDYHLDLVTLVRLDFLLDNAGEIDVQNLLDFQSFLTSIFALCLWLSRLLNRTFRRAMEFHVLLQFLLGGQGSATPNHLTSKLPALVLRADVSLQVTILKVEFRAVLEGALVDHSIVLRLMDLEVILEIVL